jgi:hypothetical protein
MILLFLGHVTSKIHAKIQQPKSVPTMLKFQYYYYWGLNRQLRHVSWTCASTYQYLSIPAFSSRLWNEDGDLLFFRVRRVCLRIDGMHHDLHSNQRVYPLLVTPLLLFECQHRQRSHLRLDTFLFNLLR